MQFIQCLDKEIQFMQWSDKEMQFIQCSDNEKLLMQCKVSIIFIVKSLLTPLLHGTVNDACGVRNNTFVSVLMRLLYIMLIKPDCKLYLIFQVKQLYEVR